MARPAGSPASLAAARNSTVLLVMIVAIVVVIAIVVIVPIMTATIKVPLVALVPAVIVVNAAVIPVPIATEKPLAIVMGSNPTRAGIRRTRPVTPMPAIVPTDRIPIALHPHVVWSRRNGPHNQDAWRGWRADSDSDRNLCVSRRYSQPQNKCEESEQGRQTN